MDIGKLNRRVEILAQKKTRDEYGGENIEWVTAERVWASIESVSGTEYFSAQQVSAETVVTITMRYNPKLTVLNRIQYLDKTYEIIGISDKSTQHEMTVLNCKERVDDGLHSKAEEG